MAIRKRGNMIPKAGISRGPRSFGKGGKKPVRKYSCGGKLKK